MRSKSKGYKERGVSSSRSPPLPIASKKRISLREASSGTLYSDFSSATSNTKGPIAISTAFPEPLSLSSIRSNMSLSIDKSSGNIRSRRGRHLDK
ncbi:hypothetical protein LB504_010040 [Fusarium proliferatum]|nr:hypothetical protein LB504_010040 [Fusarium proliferatum]